MERRAVFVLAACDDGPMLIPRTDAQVCGRHVVGVGSCLLELGSHSQGEVDALLKITSVLHSRHSEHVMALDVGANLGSHLVPWAKFMTGWGSILGIEAQERIFYALCGNITVNNLFNARAIWAAASDREGILMGPTVDYGTPGNFGGVSMLKHLNGQQPVKDYKQAIPSVTIDGMKLPRLDIMKIDVEGMEPYVLRGARETIARCKPVIFAEQAICGEKELRAELPPFYDHQVTGGNCLCMVKGDPIWGMLTNLEAA